MPTILRSGPYRFFFYSGDLAEPPHVHVEREECEAKFWLDPVLLEHSHGFGRKEINTLLRLVTEHRDQLLESWHEFFHG